MYLSKLTIRNFRQFGSGPDRLELSLGVGITALVGRNDSGKTSVIDAIRYALLTRDQEYIRVQPDDFFVDTDGIQASEIVISCEFSDLSDAEKGAFIEHLSYNGSNVVLIVHWKARRLSERDTRRSRVAVSVRSGEDGVGPRLEMPVRELLSAAYLRPLRDAESEMSPRRGSRLSQILFHVPGISDGQAFDVANVPQDAEAAASLGLVGLSDYMRYLIRMHEGIRGAETDINTHYLRPLLLHDDSLISQVDVPYPGEESARLRRVLERLDLGLVDSLTAQAWGRYGLGSNNLLFMACELLLLGKEHDALPLLLIEEPEAHLHPQRQLRLMDFLVKAADGGVKTDQRATQVLLTTHSPNLASKIPLNSIVLMEGKQAFSFARGHTKLDAGDYGYLERFLDVTKANLFFAHGVLIVEGAAEAILLPTIAKLIGSDLTEYGVSVVNVGGKGLRRYSRIFQRKNEDETSIGVRVACIADLDVMPDCAPQILGLVSSDDDDKWRSDTRRWKAVSDFGHDDESRINSLLDLRRRLQDEDGEGVRTFISDHWTLEYDIAISGLAEECFVASELAKNDEPLNERKKSRRDVVRKAQERFAELQSEFGNDSAILCSHVYRAFHSRAASKAIAAQYLSEILSIRFRKGHYTAESLRESLPNYLVEAIDYVADK